MRTLSNILGEQITVVSGCPPDSVVQCLFFFFILSPPSKYRQINQMEAWDSQLPVFLVLSCQSHLDYEDTCIHATHITKNTHKEKEKNIWRRRRDVAKIEGSEEGEKDVEVEGKR